MGMGKEAMADSQVMEDPSSIHRSTEDTTRRARRWDMHNNLKGNTTDRQDPTALKAVTDHRAMEADTRLDTDHKDSISMIGGTGVLGSWKRS